MKRQRPFKKVAGTRRVGIEPFAGSVGAALGGTAFMLVDELECGHEYRAAILVSPSKSPYRKLEDGTRLRRCNKCPLEVSG